jgi:hypothetical protein
MRRDEQHLSVALTGLLHGWLAAVCIVDPPGHRARWFRLSGDAYEKTDRSDLLAVTGTDLEAGIDWPG